MAGTYGKELTVKLEEIMLLWHELYLRWPLNHIGNPGGDGCYFYTNCNYYTIAGVAQVICLHSMVVSFFIH